MSQSIDQLLHKALQALAPEERDELLHAVLVQRLGTLQPAATALAAVAGGPPAWLPGAGFEVPTVAGTPLKVLPVRLPEAEHERLRRFCQSSGFSMAVVIRTLVERFLAQQPDEAQRA